MIVVAGATGFVGRALCPALQRAGFEVRCGTRDVASARQRWPDEDWVHLDVDQPRSLAAAFAGAETLVYLVHQMAQGHAGLCNREVRSARRVREAAEGAGLHRVVYLGGPAPEETCSEHLAARLRTGEILRGGSVTTLELRAAMIIGAGSESWLIVRDLALRLPVMVLPRWLVNRSMPIAIDDVVAALVRSVDLPLAHSQWVDLPGPEVLSGRQILERVAAQVGLRPWMIPVGVLTPRLSSHWLRLVTRADYKVAQQLVHGLLVDLLPADEGFWALAPELTQTPFDEAVRSALSREASLGRCEAVWERLVRLRIRDVFSCVAPAGAKEA